MTLLEKFKKDHPDAPLNEDTTPKCCPYHLGYVDGNQCVDYIEGVSTCIRCWNREYEGEDKKGIEASKDVADKIKDTFVKLHEAFDHGVSIAIVYRLIDRGYFDK